MVSRAAVLSLVLVPAISWADAAAPDSPALAAKPRSPKQMQADHDHGGVPERLPANGRLRIPVALGQAETAVIRLVENGKPVGFGRKVVMPAVRGDVPWVELVPGRALLVDATVIVFVAGVRSGTYHVTPADLTPPELTSAAVQSFEMNLPAQEHTWGLGRPARDEVLVSLQVLDEAPVRVRGVLLTLDAAPPVDSINSTVVASGASGSSLLVFPPGSIPKDGPALLRLEAVDGAGNIGWSKTIELRPAPPAAADASVEPARAPEPAPRAVGRGCG